MAAEEGILETLEKSLKECERDLGEAETCLEILREAAIEAREEEELYKTAKEDFDRLRRAFEVVSGRRL